MARGRYGLGSKDVQPGDVLAVFENLWSEEPKPEFTLSIENDVTCLSVRAHIIRMLLMKALWLANSGDWVLTVLSVPTRTALRLSGTIPTNTLRHIFSTTQKNRGGYYFPSEIRGMSRSDPHTYVKQADFVACHKASCLDRYYMVEDIKKGGTFLLNCPWSDNELEDKLPGNVKKYIARNDVQFYTCDAVTIAKEMGWETEPIPCFRRPSLSWQISFL